MLVQVQPYQLSINGYVAISLLGEVTNQVLRDEEGLAAPKRVEVIRGPSKDRSLNIKELLHPRKPALPLSHLGSISERRILFKVRKSCKFAGRNGQKHCEPFPG